MHLTNAGGQIVAKTPNCRNKFIGLRSFIVTGVVYWCVVVGCSASVSAQPTPLATNAHTLFDFHSGFWINLHHFLYLEAASQKPPNGPHAATVSKTDTEIYSSLNREERSAWDAAVSYYQESVVKRDLLFDEGMRAIKN